MEKQLAEYRMKKAKEASQQRSSFLKSLFAREKRSNVFTGASDEDTKQHESTEYDSLYPRLRTFLKIVLWCCSLGFFVQVGFGSVFFVASLFYFMYISMKAGTRRAWEPSAYSVFNENCEAIDGTLSGQQFDQELKFGAGSVGK